MEHKYLLVCVTFLFVDGQSTEHSVEPAGPGDVPYAVVLQLGGYFCSGALVHPAWVLTAAHCVYRHQQKNITILAGTLHRSPPLSNNSVVQISSSASVLIHPLYNTTWASHDIALIQMVGKVEETEYVKPVALSMEPWGTGSRLCTVSGFGRLQQNTSKSLDGQLKTHRLSISRPCPCENQLSKEKGYNRVHSWLCSDLRQHSGPCKGDSGAPLVCDGALRGLTSSTFYIYNPATCDMSREPKEPQCGTPHELYIFMDTYSHLPWLRDVMLSATSGSRSQRWETSDFIFGAVLIVFLQLLVYLVLLLTIAHNYLYSTVHHPR